MDRARAASAPLPAGGRRRGRAASVSRTVQPSSAAARARRRRSAWSGRHQQRAAVALGQAARRRAVEHLVREVEQAHQVRDRDAGAADALADLLAGEAELVDEQRAGARLLDRVQVLAGHVLDQRRARATRGPRGSRRRPGRRPARRAARRASGARRRSARRSRPGSGRTSTGCRTPRSRTDSESAEQRVLVEGLPRLARVRRDQLDRQAAQLGSSSAAARARSVGERIAARPRPMPRLVSHGRPPPWRARSRPRSPRSADRGG